MKKIFISCVSSEFKSLRNKAAVGLKRNFEPVYQEDFNFEPISLKKSLIKKLQSCHGIIHIVGEGYGAEFPPNDPECNPDGNISYTQWELRMVEEMNRKSFRKKSIWLIFPEPDCFKDTATEWLDWPMNEELSDEDRMAIQQRRRELQLAYKQSLLSNRNNYGFRKPKNGHEFNQVIDALVKKEKKKQHIFASVITMLCLGAILAGFFGYQNLSKISYRKEINGKEDNLRKQPTEEKFITPKYFKMENNEQRLFMSTLTASSLDSIKASDQNVADQCIIELDRQSKLAKIEREPLDGMLKKIDNHSIKSNLLQVFAGFVFQNGDFEYASELIESVDCKLDKILKQQALFEIQYNIFVKTIGSDSTSQKKDKIEDAIENAISAMEEIAKHDSEFKTYTLYEFDMIDLKYQRLDFVFRSQDKIDDKSLKDIELMASELTNASQNLRSGNEEIRSQIQTLYSALGKMVCGSAKMKRVKQGYDNNDYHEAEKLFNEALKELLPEEPIVWQLESDEKQAFRAVANIYEEYAPLFRNWSRAILDDYRIANHEFSIKLTNAGVSKKDKSNVEWRSVFLRNSEDYKLKRQEIDEKWNTCKVSYKNHVDSYDFMRERLGKYSGEAYIKIAINKAGEVESQFSDAKREGEDCVRAWEKNLAEANAILVQEKEKKPDVLVKRDLTRLERCLGELDVPTLDGAKKCVAELDKLAKDEKEKKPIVQNAIELSNLIKNVFTAEANLKAAEEGIVTAENNAAVKEDSAREYLKPNSFGTVRTEMARKNFTEAETLRRNAQEKLSTARESVTEQLRQVALSAKIYYDSDQKRGGAVLAGLAYAVMKRTGISYDGEMPLTEEDTEEIKNVGKTVEGVIKGE